MSGTYAAAVSVRGFFGSFNPAVTVIKKIT
jgi:hypothetical protein